MQAKTKTVQIRCAKSPQKLVEGKKWRAHIRRFERADAHVQRRRKPVLPGHGALANPQAGLNLINIPGNYNGKEDLDRSGRDRHPPRFRNAASINGGHELSFGTRLCFPAKATGPACIAAVGWTAGDIVTAQSCFPFSLQLGYDPNRHWRHTQPGAAELRLQTRHLRRLEA